MSRRQENLRPREELTQGLRRKVVSTIGYGYPEKKGRCTAGRNGSIDREKVPTRGEIWRSLFEAGGFIVLGKKVGWEKGESTTKSATLKKQRYEALSRKRKKRFKTMRRSYSGAARSGSRETNHWGSSGGGPGGN